MRKIIVGSAVIAVLTCLGVIAYQTPSRLFDSIVLLIVAGAIAVAYLGYYAVRQRRLQTWSRAAGRIDSCIQGAIDEGSQEYICTYAYSVKGTRQGGSFKFLDRLGRFEEIRAALVGEVIFVLYDPCDHTKSIVEESRIKGWEIA